MSSVAPPPPRPTRGVAVVRSTAVTIPAATGTLRASAHCGAGEEVIAGGYALEDSRLTVPVSRPEAATGEPPVPGHPATQWTVQIHNPAHIKTSATVYAVCLPAI